MRFLALQTFDLEFQQLWLLSVTRMDDPHMVYGHELHVTTPRQDKSTRSSLAEIPRLLLRMQMTQQSQTTLMCGLAILPSLRSGLAWLLEAQSLTRGHCTWQWDARSERNKV
jgi:hypothetical protein